jgi:hypothetical protein
MQTQVDADASELWRGMDHRVKRVVSHHFDEVVEIMIHTKRRIFLLFIWRRRPERSGR